jgi:Leucine-rich repeat (LRR) protein
MSTLNQLYELNMAQNNIETIGIGLDGLVSLRDLNLSANRIGNFKEVLNLNRLPNLIMCNFIDPHYGENPICSLCNY